VLNQKLTRRLLGADVAASHPQVDLVVPPFFSTVGHLRRAMLFESLFSALRHGTVTQVTIVVVDSESSEG
jgi:hypothetical protein